MDHIDQVLLHVMIHLRLIMVFMIEDSKVVAKHEVVTNCMEWNFIILRRGGGGRQWVERGQKCERRSLVTKSLARPDQACW